MKVAIPLRDIDTQVASSPAYWTARNQDYMRQAANDLLREKYPYKEYGPAVLVSTGSEYVFEFSDAK